MVCEVYEVDCWIETKNVNRKGRYEFIGKIAQDSIRNLFINNKLPQKYRKKGMASPILYHYKES